MKHIPLNECEICSQIQGAEYANFLANDILSPAAEKLVGETRGYDMFENITACPHCGTFYKNTNDCGFMENDLSLWRISPTEAGETLSEEDLAFLKKCLTSDDKNTAEYAGLCLTDHALKNQDKSDLRELLFHPNRNVRLTAVVRLRGHDEIKEHEDLMSEVLEKETDEQVRLNTKL